MLMLTLKNFRGGHTTKNVNIFYLLKIIFIKRPWWFLSAHQRPPVPYCLELQANEQIVRKKGRFFLFLKMFLYKPAVDINCGLTL